VCADGGANRLHDISPPPGETSPDIIVGDLDSLHQHVRDDYEREGTMIVKDADQNRHDLDKALTAVATYSKIPVGAMTVLILGAFGGRFDHQVAALQALYCHTSTFHRLLLVGDETFAELLLPGSHEIHPNEECEFGGHCGLLPIGCPVTCITTTGLRWDLQGSSLAFGEGGLVSSSNIIDKKAISVVTSDPVVWTTEHWY